MYVLVVGFFLFGKLQSVLVSVTAAALYSHAQGGVATLLLSYRT